MLESDNDNLNNYIRDSDKRNYFIDLEMQHKLREDIVESIQHQTDSVMLTEYEYI